MRIGILSNITIDLIKDELEKYLISWSLNPEIYLSGFNQIHQEILMSDSGLKEFNPSDILVFIDLEEYLWDIISGGYIFDDNKGKGFKLVDEIIAVIEKGLSRFNNSNFFINNAFVRPISTWTLEYNSKYSVKDFENYFDSKLLNLRENWSNLFVVDYKSFDSQLGWENIYDPRMFYIGSIRFNKRGHRGLAKLYGRYIRAVRGKIKKVLVLDADNVLWGGIIGEEGLNRIKLDTQKTGRIYRDFQRIVLNLYKKGIIITLNSKNNFEDVIEVLRKHPYQVLKEEHFSNIKVNWNNKVQNIKEIAEELNLGIDSFVFIDDSEFERSLVQSELQEVSVPDFPQDMAKLVDFMNYIEREFFPKIALTPEDRKRGKMYKAEAMRSNLKKQLTDIKEFYKSLEMKVFFGELNQNVLPRIAQLTQRTNQFNFTTKRYTEADLLDIAKKGGKIFWIRLVDKFGDSGIVGVIIIKFLDQVTAYIDTFLMSCRVIGRTVEDIFLWAVEEELIKNGVRKIVGEYIPTRKNTLVKDKYDEFNFKLLEKRADGTKMYTKNLPEDHIKKSEYIELITIKSNVNMEDKL